MSGHSIMPVGDTPIIRDNPKTVIRPFEDKQ